MRTIRTIAVTMGWVSVLACSSPSAPSGTTPAQGTTPAASDPNAEAGPLEVGTDYASWAKLNTALVLSRGHGSRFVDTYVNEVGLEAYKDRKMAVPVGSVIVKTSFEAARGAPTAVAGPVFVMEKKPAGFDAEHNDWWYAIHWETVPESWQGRVGGEQIYWRTPSTKVNYCWKCHDKFPRELGGIPRAKRAW